MLLFEVDNTRLFSKWGSTIIMNTSQCLLLYNKPFHKSLELPCYKVILRFTLIKNNWLHWISLYIFLVTEKNSFLHKFLRNTQNIPCMTAKDMKPRGKNILVLSNQTMICTLLKETVFLEECIKSQTHQQTKYYFLVTNMLDPRGWKQYVFMSITTYFQTAVLGPRGSRFQLLV